MRPDCSIGSHTTGTLPPISAPLSWLRKVVQWWIRKKILEAIKHLVAAYCDLVNGFEDPNEIRKARAAEDLDDADLELCANLELALRLEKYNYAEFCREEAGAQKKKAKSAAASSAYSAIHVGPCNSVQHRF